MSNDFSCPHEIPASVKDDLFCTPLKCPGKVPVKRFSSPNTQLSPEEFEKQKQCIEQINNLLITITSPKDPNNFSALRLHFKMLRGTLVEVEFACNNSKDTIKGLLKETGKDFLEIEDNGKRYFIPYIRICMINSNDCNPSENHNELENIDEGLRRDIVLNFGKVVSADPKLINFFFGIPLYLQLANLVGTKVVVKVEGEPDVVGGILVESTKTKVCIKTLDNTIIETNIVDICSILI